MRLLTNTVPLSPRRSERAFGTPLMNTSILNPFGSLSCGTGSLSAAIGKGGGLMPRSLPAASEVGWFGVGGGGVGVACCAAAVLMASVPATAAAITKPFWCDRRMGMELSLMFDCCAAVSASSHPARNRKSPIRRAERSRDRITIVSHGFRLLAGPVTIVSSRHAPVDVGCVDAHRSKLRDAGVIGGELTHRIGRRGIAGEREGLAPAAAEVDFAARTAGARLLHPGRAAERIKGRRVRPDIGERMLAHAPEFEAG